MWFQAPPDQRILVWRNWRHGLHQKSPIEIVNEVAYEWSKVPTVNHYLCPDQSEDWPTPWQLIYDNLYCDLGICLGMFYTLALIEDPCFDDLEIRIYQDNNGWVNLSSLCQGKYVLNYNFGNVVNIEQLPIDMRLVFLYSKIDLLHLFN